jgi:hypothetical protein
MGWFVIVILLIVLIALAFYFGIDLDWTDLF